MVMGFRRSPFKFGSASPASPYDASSQAFFNYAAGFGTLSTAEKSAADTLIRALKANGPGNSYWDEANRIYLMIGSNINVARVCCKTLTQATLVNTPSLYDRNVGIDWGGSSCFKTGFNPSVNGSPGGLLPGWAEDIGSLGFTVYDPQDNSGNWVGMSGLSCAVMGAENPSFDGASYIFLDAGDYYGAINVEPSNSISPSYLGTAYQTCRFQTSYTHSYEDGAEFLEDNTSPSMAFSLTELYVGAYNVGGSPSSIMSDQPMTSAWIGGQMANCEQYFITFNNTLGRIYT